MNGNRYFSLGHGWIAAGPCETAALFGGPENGRWKIVPLGTTIIAQEDDWRGRYVKGTGGFYYQEYEKSPVD